MGLDRAWRDEDQEGRQSEDSGDIDSTNSEGVCFYLLHVHWYSVQIQ
jgi:hypothetical protein